MICVDCFWEWGLLFPRVQVINVQCHSIEESWIFLHLVAIICDCLLDWGRTWRPLPLLWTRILSGLSLRRSHVCCQSLWVPMWICSIVSVWKKKILKIIHLLQLLSSFCLFFYIHPWAMRTRVLNVSFRILTEVRQLVRNNGGRGEDF